MKGSLLREEMCSRCGSRTNWTGWCFYWGTTCDYKTNEAHGLLSLQWAHIRALSTTTVHTQDMSQLHKPLSKIHCEWHAHKNKQEPKTCKEPLEQLLTQLDSDQHLWQWFPPFLLLWNVHIHHIHVVAEHMQLLDYCLVLQQIVFPSDKGTIQCDLTQATSCRSIYWSDWSAALSPHSCISSHLCCLLQMFVLIRDRFEQRALWSGTGPLLLRLSFIIHTDRL